MTHFLHQPQGIFLRSDEELISVGKSLEVATYMVSVTPQGEFFLSKIENFKRADKTYGTVQDKAKRIMHTFEDRSNSTGILLSGEQGSGKTMMARELSILAADKGMATIIVNAPYCGPGFNQFIQMINIPAVVIFDEFEKMYDDDGQEKMLTLLDGLFPSKKLFILTCNNVYRIDQHLLNRPGRIFYHIKYKGLEEAFITEYCEDKLNNKEHISGVECISRHFDAFNFDMLKAIVEEMNRFNMDASEAVEFLNMSPVSTKDSAYNLKVTINGEAVNLYEADYHGNPLTSGDIQIRSEYIGVYDEDDAKSVAEYNKLVDFMTSSDAKDSKSDKESYFFFNFSIDDLKMIKNGVYTFAKGNTVLKMQRKQEKPFKFISF